MKRTNTNKFIQSSGEQLWSAIMTQTGTLVVAVVVSLLGADRLSENKTDKLRSELDQIITTEPNYDGIKIGNTGFFSAHELNLDLSTLKDNPNKKPCDTSYPCTVDSKTFPVPAGFTGHVVVSGPFGNWQKIFIVGSDGNAQFEGAGGFVYDITENQTYLDRKNIKLGTSIDQNLKASQDFPNRKREILENWRITNIPIEENHIPKNDEVNKGKVNVALIGAVFNKKKH